MQRFLQTRIGQAILAAVAAAAALFVEELTRQLGILPAAPTIVGAALSALENPRNDKSIAEKIMSLKPQVVRHDGVWWQGRSGQVVSVNTVQAPGVFLWHAQDNEPKLGIYLTADGEPVIQCRDGRGKLRIVPIGQIISFVPFTPAEAGTASR